MKFCREVNDNGGILIPPLCFMNLKEIGKLCANYRRSLNVTQQQVADFLGYSAENISSFENGRNDNFEILLWYIYKGIDINLLINVIKEIK